MSTPGYTRLTATRLGEGARENWEKVAINGQESHSGHVIQSFDRTVYAAFNTEARNRPYVLALGTSAVRQGPLMVSTDAGPEISFSDLVEPKNDCQIRPTAGESEGYVLSLGSILEIEIDSDLIESSHKPPCIRDICSIERGGPVWQRSQDVLQKVQAEKDDGLGWLDILVTTDDAEYENERFERVMKTLEDLSEQPEAADITPLTELVGLGPGATPSGDDIISGILFTLVRTTSGQKRQTIQEVAETIIRQSESATTTMSLALMEQAVQGRAPETVENCLYALLDQNPSINCKEAASKMVKIGHHSGSDALVGMLIVLFAAARS